MADISATAATEFQDAMLERIRANVERAVIAAKERGLKSFRAPMPISLEAATALRKYLVSVFPTYRIDLEKVVATQTAKATASIGDVDLSGSSEDYSVGEFSFLYLHIYLERPVADVSGSVADLSGNTDSITHLPA
jgi:hypothetical protein